MFFISWSINSLTLNRTYYCNKLIVLIVWVYSKSFKTVKSSHNFSNSWTTTLMLLWDRRYYSKVHRFNCKKGKTIIILLIKGIKIIDCTENKLCSVGFLTHPHLFIFSYNLSCVPTAPRLGPRPHTPFPLTVVHFHKSKKFKYQNV